MKTTTQTLTQRMLCISENCGDNLPAKKRNTLARVTKFFLPLLLGLLLVSGINAQTIMSYQSAIQTLEPSVVVHLKSLATEIHPKAYLNQGVITTYGEGAPVVAICDAASINMLYENNPALSQIEMIRITANDVSGLPSSINFTQLQGLEDLKYLYVVFAFNACGGGSDGCLASMVAAMIQGTSSQITVIYSLSIPE